MQVSNIRPLTQSHQNGQSYIDGRPCFSPDGKTVLFERSGGNLKLAQFWSIPLEGAVSELIYYFSDSYNCYRADWCWSNTPNPEMIAFTAIANKESTIMLLIPGGGTNSAIPLKIDASNRDDSLLSYPAWYPNNEFLLLADYSKLQLLKADLNGHHPIPLTPHLFMSGMGAVSSQNPNIIAFAGQPRTSGGYNQKINQIWIQDGDSDPELFSSDEKGAIGRAPWFSPDATIMAFEAFGDNGRLQIFLKPITVPYQSVAAVQVSTAALFAQHAKFSPDGKTLVWAQQTSEDCSQIYCGTINY